MAAGGGFGGGGRGAAGPVEIKHTATDITIGMATYELDGTEVTVPGGRGGDAKAKASWIGTKLLITTTRVVQGVSITTKEERSLDAGARK